MTETVSRKERTRMNRVIEVYLESFPHMVNAGYNKLLSQTAWCWDHVPKGEWAYCTFTEDGYYYFFKDRAKAVEFALRCV